MEWERADGSGDGGMDAGGGLPSKKKKGGKKRGCLVVILVVTAIIAISSIGSCISRQPKNLDWPTTGLAARLPKPSVRKGEVNTNSETYFSATLQKCSRSDYETYLEACEETGYTVEAENVGSSYSAFDGDGYGLRLSFSEYSEEVDIHLDAPEELGTISWPKSGLAALVPAPASTTGRIMSDSSSHFSVTMGDMGLEAYSAYVDSCMAAGFTVDYNRGDKSFSADNESGASLSVSYKGNNRMSIAVDAPDSSAASAASSQAASTEAAATESPAASEGASGEASSSGVRADFKEFCDGYESYMNSYCDFMETYDSSDMAAVAKYAQLMVDYNDWATKFDDYDTGELTDEELSYYLAVQARVLQRLSEVQ